MSWAHSACVVHEVMSLCDLQQDVVWHLRVTSHLGVMWLRDTVNVKAGSCTRVWFQAGECVCCPLATREQTHWHAGASYGVDLELRFTRVKVLQKLQYCCLFETVVHNIVERFSSPWWKRDALTKLEIYGVFQRRLSKIFKNRVVGGRGKWDTFFGNKLPATVNIGNRIKTYKLAKWWLKLAN